MWAARKMFSSARPVVPATLQKMGSPLAPRMLSGVSPALTGASCVTPGKEGGGSSHRYVFS